MNDDKTLYTRIPILRSNDSYTAWKNGIETYLIAIGCQGIVDGTDTEPLEATGATRTAVARTTRAGSVQPATNTGEEIRTAWEKWSKRELRVQGVIRSTVSKGLLVDLLDMHSARDMWNFLAETHPTNTPEARASLRRDMANLFLRDLTPRGMERHLERFNELVLRFHDAGEKLTSEERSQRFIDTFPEPLSAIRTMYSLATIVQGQHWQTILKLYNQEITRREQVRPRSEAVLYTDGRRTKGRPIEGQKHQAKPKGKPLPRQRDPKKADAETRTCYNCNTKGHLAKNCPQPRKPRDDQQRGERRHDQDRDRGERYDEALAIIDFDQQAFMTRRVENEWMWDEDYYSLNERVAKEKALNATPHDPNEGWIADTGATSHLTPHRHLLRNRQKLESPVRFGVASKGDDMIAYEVGQATLRMDSGRTATIEPVYWVPGSRVSLLSISAATNQGWTLGMSKHKATLNKGEDKLTLSKSDRLWTTPHSEAVYHTEVVRSKLEEEHQRLGHVGKTKLLELGKQGKLRYKWEDIKDDNFQLTDCPTCQEWKAVRSPKNQEGIRATKDCDVIHVDITGPFRPSRMGHTWLGVIIDDHSGTIEARPMTSKTEILPVVKETVALWERQLEGRVKTIRSDGEPVLLSTEARDWYRQLGIQHQVTPRYTPELNGKAERTIRTLKDGIRAMVNSSGLGHEYWDYAAQYYAVIINKLSEDKQGRTAWEKLTGRKPNLESVRKFGDYGYAQIPAEIRSKALFETPTAARCRIIGQDYNVSGWIVLMEDTGRVMRSRDVRGLTKTGGPLKAAPQDPSTKGPTGRVHDYIELSHDFEEEEEEEDTSSVNAPIRDQTTAPPGAREEVQEHSDDPLPDDATVHGEAPPRDKADKITFEMVEPRSRSGWDDEAGRYIDKTGAMITNELQSQLKKKYKENRRGMTDLEKDIHKRWKRHYLAEHVEQPDDWYSQGHRDRHLGSEEALKATLDISEDEPKTYRQATTGPNGAEWRAAVKAELDNLHNKGTWKPVRLPSDRKAIGCKWVFKRKRDAEGKVVKYKARLVAKGYTQQPGIDYEETFAPVGRLCSLRIILAIATKLGLVVRQGDVEGAYLNGRINELVYMMIPEGLDNVPKGCDTLEIIGALYGLKQSGREWWLDVGRRLTKLGFKRLENDWGMYYRPPTADRGGMIIMVYVDDFVMAARKKQEIDEVMRELGKHWTITDLGEVNSILGLKVTRDLPRGKVWLSQPAYIDKLGEKFPLTTSRAYDTPLPTITTITKNPKEGTLDGYRQLIGSLMWLATSTRPDISFATSFLARATNAPTEQHWQMGLRMVAYLKATRNLALKYGRGSEGLVGWVDADYAGCLDTRRSTTGYLFKLHDSPIAWSSKRQATVATSTTEAEYIALAEGCREATWLRSLLKEMNYSQQGPTILHCDNQGSIQLAKNPGTHQRTKHIDIKHHLIREKIESEEVRVIYVETSRQEADILTKSLPRNLHKANTQAMGLIELRSAQFALYSRQHTSGHRREEPRRLEPPTPRTTNPEGETFPSYRSPELPGRGGGGLFSQEAEEVETIPRTSETVPITTRDHPATKNRRNNPLRKKEDDQDSRPEQQHLLHQGEGDAAEARGRTQRRTKSGDSTTLRHTRLHAHTIEPFDLRIAQRGRRGVGRHDVSRPWSRDHAVHEQSSDITKRDTRHSEKTREKVRLEKKNSTHQRRQHYIRHQITKQQPYRREFVMTMDLKHDARQGLVHVLEPSSLTSGENSKNDDKDTPNGATERDSCADRSKNCNISIQMEKKENIATAREAVVQTLPKGPWSPRTRLATKINLGSLRSDHCRKTTTGTAESTTWTYPFEEPSSRTIRKTLQRYRKDKSDRSTSRGEVITSKACRPGKPLKADRVIGNLRPRTIGDRRNLFLSYTQDHRPQISNIRLVGECWKARQLPLGPLRMRQTDFRKRIPSKTI